MPMQKELSEMVRIEQDIRFLSLGELRPKFKVEIKRNWYFSYALGYLGSMGSHSELTENKHKLSYGIMNFMAHSTNFSAKFNKV